METNRENEMMTDFDLTGRVAIVTGGGRGIGRSIAISFARAGADVIPVSRTGSEIESVVQEIVNCGRESFVHPIDITDGDAVEELFSETIDALGGVDIVVNNAGINPKEALGKPEAVEPMGFDRVLEVDLKSAFRCAQIAAPHLHASDAGVLINIASVGGLVGLPRQHPYVAAKHGLVGLTRSMAIDWAPDVRVNAIVPGYVTTDLTSELREIDRLRTSIIDATPMGRFAEPEEIAGSAVFLASDAASFVTGHCLVVDGGWTAR